MGGLSALENIVANKMLGLHTAYLASVIGVANNLATVQPLGLYKEVGKTAQYQAIVSNIPIVKSAVDDIAVGDIVICVVCDRNITDAKKGINTLPPYGNHNMSDSIVVGIL